MGDGKYYRQKFIENLPTYSISDNYQEARLEFHISHVTTGTPSSCICTKDITECVHIKNIHTGRIVIIGKDCAKHILTKEELDEMKKEFSAFTRKTRDCIDCGKRIKKEPKKEWKVRCNKCYWRFKNRSRT